jgi:hypothetical protein
MTSVEVRQKLVHALGLDRIGPARHSELLAELLPQAPSHWYLGGFVVPIDAGGSSGSRSGSPRTRTCCRCGPTSRSCRT